MCWAAVELSYTPFEYFRFIWILCFISRLTKENWKRQNKIGSLLIIHEPFPSSSFEHDSSFFFSLGTCLFSSFFLFLLVLLLLPFWILKNPSSQNLHRVKSQCSSQFERFVYLVRRWLCHGLLWQPLPGLKKQHQILVLTAGRSDSNETDQIFTSFSLSLFLFYPFLRSHGSAWLCTKPKRRISRCWRAQQGFSWPLIVSVRIPKTVLFLTVL